jgi:hypothetical protein
MATRPKPVTDFNPQSQAPGPVKTNPMSQGMLHATQRGGSKPTPQAALLKAGPAGGKSSAPQNPQKLRG